MKRRTIVLTFRSWVAGLKAWVSGLWTRRLIPVRVPKAEVPRQKTKPRRGLAMLELTLALPIMLFVMALIYNYGIAAAWKVRENSVARLAIWQSRWPRSGASDPKPSYWFPATATMGA